MMGMFALELEFAADRSGLQQRITRDTDCDTDRMGQDCGGMASVLAIEAGPIKAGQWAAAKEIASASRRPFLPAQPGQQAG
jgi:hypothetical protein